MGVVALIEVVPTEREMYIGAGCAFSSIAIALQKMRGIESRNHHMVKRKHHRITRGIGAGTRECEISGNRPLENIKYPSPKSISV